MLKQQTVSLWLRVLLQRRESFYRRSARKRRSKSLGPVCSPQEGSPAVWEGNDGRVTSGLLQRLNQFYPKREARSIDQLQEPMITSLAVAAVILSLIGAMAIRANSFFPLLIRWRVKADRCGSVEPYEKGGFEQLRCRCAGNEDE